MCLVLNSAMDLWFQLEYNQVDIWPHGNNPNSYLYYTVTKHSHKWRYNELWVLAQPRKKGDKSHDITQTQQKAAAHIEHVDLFFRRIFFNWQLLFRLLGRRRRKRASNSSIPNPRSLMCATITPTQIIELNGVDSVVD